MTLPPRPDAQPGHHGPAVSGRWTLSRRQLLSGSAAAAGTALAAVAAGPGSPAGAAAPPGTSPGESIVPFDGPYQAGILTPQQRYLVLTTFDLLEGDRYGLADLLAGWTVAARRLASGQPLSSGGSMGDPPADSGAALGLGPAWLTLTVGFGPGLFDGRFGLAAARPAALVDLPPLPGDALDPSTSGGDLCVQACADDLQVAVHAATSLAALAQGTASIRTMQLGFLSGGGDPAGEGPSSTPRNLLGFKDGTANRAVEADASRSVWVGPESDQRWMQGGSYLVARRIRVFLDAWARTSLGGQEAAIGRHRASGAPLGGTRELAVPDFAERSAGGAFVIPEHAHIRQASPAANGGAQLLRRAYNYVDGLDPLTGAIDAGLIFICFQRDPHRQFVPIQRRLAGSDTLTTTYLLHTSSALFACPPGLAPGETWGASLDLRA